MGVRRTFQARETIRRLIRRIQEGKTGRTIKFGVILLRAFVPVNEELNE